MRFSCGVFLCGFENQIYFVKNCFCKKCARNIYCCTNYGSRGSVNHFYTVNQRFAPRPTRFERIGKTFARSKPTIYSAFHAAIRSAPCAVRFERIFEKFVQSKPTIWHATRARYAPLRDCNFPKKHGQEKSCPCDTFDLLFGKAPSQIYAASPSRKAFNSISTASSMVGWVFFCLRSETPTTMSITKSNRNKPMPTK